MNATLSKAAPILAATVFLVVFGPGQRPAPAQVMKVEVDCPVPVQPVAGGVAPALVKVRNDTKTPMRVSITADPGYYSPQRGMEYVKTIEVPPATTSQTMLYTRHDGNSYFSLRVRDEDRRDEQHPGPNLKVGRSVLGLTSSRGSVQTLSGSLEEIIAADQRGRRGGLEIIEQKDAAPLPDSWMGYDTLQLMVAEDFPYAGLTPKQEGAIVQYVENGGTIYIVPGKLGQVFKSTLLAQLADVTVAGSAPDPAMSNATRWDVQVRGARSTKLAEVVPCGAGTVVLFKYDILRPPLVGQSELRGGLGEIGKVAGRNEPARFTASTFGPTGASERKTLPPTAVIGLLFTYLLVACPGTYLLLRRKRRLVLLPIVFASVAVAFSIAIFFFGYLWKGTSTDIHESGVIRLLPGRTTAAARSTIGVMASSNRRFELTFPEETFITTANESDFRLTARDNDDGTLSAEFTSVMWALCQFEARTLLPQFGSLSVEGSGPGCIVRNQTQVDLIRCWYNNNGQWLELGSIPSGGTASAKAAMAVQAVPPDIRNARNIARTESPSGSAIVGEAAGDVSAVPYKLARGSASKITKKVYVVQEVR